MKNILIALLVIIILSTAASALEIHNTKAVGKNIDYYHDTIVFETDESDIDTDLNNDGDQEDTVIRYYNTDTEALYSTEMAGKNPSVFGYYLVFECAEKDQDQDLNEDGDKQDSIILYYHLGDKKIISTTAVGNSPSIHGTELIAFSTKESDMEIDYNNDGDTSDSIIRYYKIPDKEVINTKQVGTNPFVTDRYILFKTDEKEVDEDLNNDGYIGDTFLRIYSLETGKTVNTDDQGDIHDISQGHIAAMTKGSKVMYYDAAGQKTSDTKLTGREPSITGNFLAFSKDDKIIVYDTEKNTYAQTDVFGTSPVIFEDRIAFATEESVISDLNEDGDTKDLIVRYAVSKDLDKDGIADFADNCPEIENKEQEDKDSDGKGSACDEEEEAEKEVKKKTSKKKTEPEEQAEEITEENKTEDKIESAGEDESPEWTEGVIILAIILVILFAVFYGPVWYRKRKKSFGF